MDNTWPASDGKVAASGTNESVATPGWRTFFVDTRLHQLIDLALANNRDLRETALNIVKARAQYRIQRADLFPAVSADFRAQVAQLRR